MESAALDLRTRIEGQDTSSGGLVRVTSTDSIAIDLLEFAIERLQQHCSHIRIWRCPPSCSPCSRQVISYSATCLRGPVPVVRRVASWPVGLFASARAMSSVLGVPVPETSCGHHPGSLRAPYLEHNTLLTMRACLRARPRSRWRCAPVCCARAYAGIGLGEMPVWMGEREGLVRIWPERRRANDRGPWRR